MTDELRIARVIDAPPDVVFDTFTAEDGRLAFYGQDDPGWIVESDCDLRVGGLWTITFGPTRNHLYRHSSMIDNASAPLVRCSPRAATAAAKGRRPGRLLGGRVRSRGGLQLETQA